MCDRVAIMNTSLRTIGRPDELRQSLFSRSLGVTTAAPLAMSDRVFTRLPAVQGWHAAGANVLSITESRHTSEDVYLDLINDQEGRSR